MPVQSPMTGSGLEYYEKLWPDEFYADRNPLEEQPHVEDRLEAMLSEIDLPQDEISRTPNTSQPSVDKETSCERDEPKRLHLFLQGYENDVPTIQEEEIAEFCEGVHPSILRQRDNDQRATAWLDDRLHSFYYNPRLPQTHEPYTGTAGSAVHNTSRLPYRIYRSPLSPSSLYGYLIKKQFGHPELPDADRRLISISSLSPQFIFALTETAPAHQAPGLTDAIFKHLALQTCMSVDISHGAYTVFQLRFHMPFYALRERGPIPPDGNSVRSKPFRKWRDISFMTDSLGIHESHMAFAICGVADRRWVAYAFSDTDYDEDRTIGESESDYDGLVADQIAADGAHTIDASRPIWNPREYYLTIVSRKLNHIVGEWARLIRKFEKAIWNHVNSPPSVKTPSKGPEDNNDVMGTFDRTQKTLLILEDLRAALSSMNEAWSQFSSPDGDIGYFRHIGNASKICQRQCQRLLHDIKGKFDQAKGLQHRLDNLVRRYKMTASILELRLTLESNNTAKLSGSIAELMVAWVSPVAIVSAFFAIPEPFGNFHRTGRSFFVGTLIVFAVMKFLIYCSKGHMKPMRIWHKAKGTKDRLQQRTLQLCETVEDLRRRQLHRSDNDTSLVAPPLEAANA